VVACVAPISGRTAIECAGKGYRRSFADPAQTTSPDEAAREKRAASQNSLSATEQIGMQRALTTLVLLGHFLGPDILFDYFSRSSSGYVSERASGKPS
jgi:hypothetical protein